MDPELTMWNESKQNKIKRDQQTERPSSRGHRCAYLHHVPNRATSQITEECSGVQDRDSKGEGKVEGDGSAQKAAAGDCCGTGTVLCTNCDEVTLSFIHISHQCQCPAFVSVQPLHNI